MIQEYLSRAGVPGTLQAEAVEVLAEVHEKTSGLLLTKFKPRLLHAGDIAELLSWESERLIDVRPDLAEWDIAPMINITCNGDKGIWIGEPGQGRPQPGSWLNPDPESDDYKAAVAACYWCPGHHPRSYEARVAWYKRNAGEYVAYQRGVKVEEQVKPIVWTQDGITVANHGEAWQIRRDQHIALGFGLKYRLGHEIDNVFDLSTGEQRWYPIPGYDLKAPVSWSILPSRSVLK